MTNVRGVPKYGLKLKLNHKYPEKWEQKTVLKIKQVLPLIPLAIRYLWYYIKCWFAGDVPVMDYIKVVQGQQIYGVPVGGIGCGSIGRGFRGEFCRFQLTPGVYEYNTVYANQFIVTIRNASQETVFQSLLSTYEKPRKVLSAWESRIDGSKCLYTGLYPRSWVEYDLSEYGIKLTCRQISPVIPHNYKDSSLPCAVFVWDVENVSNEEKTVTITFSFKTGTGNKEQDKRSISASKSFVYESAEGIALLSTIKSVQCTYAIATKSTSGANVSKCLSFDPDSDGKTPWSQLERNGRFEKIPEYSSQQVAGEVAAAVAVQNTLTSQSTKTVEMCLVWDMPTITFSRRIKKYDRYYTKFFGNENASIKIVDYAFKNYENWEEEIAKWQSPILDDTKLPDWYKSAIFNELYYISDGGTVWFNLNADETSNFKATDPRIMYGRFAYLEGHEYRMYNTYDVHFYASFALTSLWPNLQLSLQYDMRDYIFTEIPETRTCWFDGKVAKVKVLNTVPHDVGDPTIEPFLMLNTYPAHDVSEWRDLNIKFVLQVFRDYSLLQNVEGINVEQYLKDMYDACHTVMKLTSVWDEDSDGVIENSGSADQTYDSWIMTGTSAYCGGLWLAALFAMINICDKLNINKEKEIYAKMLSKGKESFEKKLWNGKYYNFDSAERGDHDAIMADQLCGHWYLRSCGYEYEVFPKENVQTALNSIFKNNVMKVCDGTLGAINGCKPDGRIDDITLQSEEVWTGVTYAVAALMIREGLIPQAWKTAGGMYRTLSETIGMSFETPEALSHYKCYRAVGYMRPLSIWSMQLAWKAHRNRNRK